ncbi:hypothetical protein [Desulforhopalus singaporensis]|uniref:Uncharacterized protein n=1 Tax=Desulforhopalus singaporensis TaxID=91360 RepID=A0A1H0NQK4_9BACT|nr:hypothetical protein [Desulforhopalus singaporensis]SDO94846.1 hypothetical protein SAMN05660330_01400 [Desulforhopalus singaporensis]
MAENVKNPERRKAVKTIVGGLTAVAAYHTLPSKWGTPIVDQIFLPAHAATSGIVATYFLDVIPFGPADDWGRGALTVYADGTAVFVRINMLDTRKWEATFSSVPGVGTLVEVDRSPDCLPATSEGPGLTLNLASANGSEASFYFNNDPSRYPFTLPAASIPPEPILAGACEGGEPV